jgi:hypothetical protein
MDLKPNSCASKYVLLKYTHFINKKMKFELLLLRRNRPKGQ